MPGHRLQCNRPQFEISIAVTCDAFQEEVAIGSKLVESGLGVLVPWVVNVLSYVSTGQARMGDEPQRVLLSWLATGLPTALLLRRG